MSENSGFFNAVLDSEGNPDRAYEATDFAAYYANLISNGVFAKPADQLQVCATTGNLKVKVNAGHAYINGYWYHLSEDTDVNLSSSSSNNRYDEIVLRLNLSTREIKLITVQGADTTTSNSFPTPIVSRTDNVYDLVLAQIRVNNSGTISNADIRDVRPINAYCGFVKGLVDDISTTDLFKQYDSMFNTWFDRQKYTLEDTPVGKLQKQIDNVIKDNGIACVGFNRLFLPSEILKQLGTQTLIDEHNVFVAYNYNALSPSERPATQEVGQAQSFIRIDGTKPVFTNFGLSSVYCRGSCFNFYKAGYENIVYLKITEPGEYKINLTSSGAVAFDSQADYSSLYTIGLCIASKSVSNVMGIIPISEYQRPTAITNGRDNNYQKSVVVKITDDVLPLYISAGIFMHGGNYNINAKNMIAKMPSLEYVIEPVKLTRGIPQDLINMVATTPEGYEELKANDKIDPETAYFVSDGTNVILYLGEVKISTSKGTSLGAIQELLTGTKTSIIGQQGSVE